MYADHPIKNLLSHYTDMLEYYETRRKLTTELVNWNLNFTMVDNTIVLPCQFSPVRTVNITTFQGTLEAVLDVVRAELFAEVQGEKDVIETTTSQKLHARLFEISQLLDTDVGDARTALEKEDSAIVDELLQLLQELIVLLEKSVVA
jgi:hypothetical protein